MGGSSTTSANIPEEYKGLAGQTGNYLTEIQRYLWGDPANYAFNSNYWINNPAGGTTNTGGSGAGGGGTGGTGGGGGGGDGTGGGSDGSTGGDWGGGTGVVRPASGSVNLGDVGVAGTPATYPTGSAAAAYYANNPNRVSPSGMGFDANGNPISTNSTGTQPATAAGYSGPATIGESLPTGTTDPAMGYPGMGSGSYYVPATGSSATGVAPTSTANWLQPNTLQVAGANYPMQLGIQDAAGIANSGDWANQIAGNLYGSAIPSAYNVPSVNYNDPSIQSAVQSWYNTSLPQIQNQMELSGLGHTNALGNAESLGLASIMPSLYQQQEARADTAKAAGLAQQNATAGFYGNVGAQAPSNTQAQAQNLWNMGTQGRTDITQAQNQANYDSTQNQKNMAMNMLEGPMSSFIPSTIGSTTSSK